MLELVKGDVKDLGELEQVGNVDKILKVHKLKNLPANLVSDRTALANLLISKSASKDLVL